MALTDTFVKNVKHEQANTGSFGRQSQTRKSPRKAGSVSGVWSTRTAAQG